MPRPPLHATDPPGTILLRRRLARLDAALAAGHPALRGVGRRYRARLRWALDQPVAHHDRLATGLLGANGCGPAVDACIRDLLLLAPHPLPPTKEHR